MKTKHPLLIIVSHLALMFAVPGLLIPCLGHAQKDDPLLGKDFSKTNVLTIFLAEAERGDEPAENGLEHVYWEKDGLTSVTVAQGTSCRCLTLKEQGHSRGYLYFIIAPTFKGPGMGNVKIEVEYFDGFDGQTGVFGLHYDASTTGSANSAAGAYAPAGPTVQLKGSTKWLKAAFQVRNGTFQNSQNGRSDFRLWASPPELCVSRVTVTRELPKDARKPSEVGAAGEVKLGEWTSQLDWGYLTFAKNTGNPKGPPNLEIRADGKSSIGSWRTWVLLEAGEYQFVGKARTEGLEIRQGRPSGGVNLRTSGDRARTMNAPTEEWAALTHNFSVPALADVELVCEFFGSQGSAFFDSDSLKLIRKSKTSKAVTPPAPSP